MSLNIAVLGATGAVGHEVLSILSEREFPADSVVALASSKSVGQQVSYGEDLVLKVQNAEHFDFSNTQIVFSAAGSQTSKALVSKITQAGAIVIDKTSLFRMDPDVPLVVPEVNKGSLMGYINKGIISNPNCVAIPLTMALKPLQEIAAIKRVSVATYQSVSGAGRQAMDELFAQTRAVYVNDAIEKNSFTKQIGFNVIPHIDEFDKNGQTGEETKIAQEVQKILGGTVPVFATCVRVPVFIGHSMAVHVEFEGPITDTEARNAMKKFPGLSVIDHRVNEGYVTPIEAAGDDLVFVSRIRKDPTVPNGLGFWVVSDNLRKGAALNAVQIAEHLLPLFKK